MPSICTENDPATPLMGEIRLLNGYYGKLHPDTIRDLVDRDGIRIYYDRRVHAFLDVTSKTTKAFEV